MSTESNLKGQLVGNEHVEESKESRLSEIAPTHTGSEVETGSLQSSKKRKPDSASQKTRGDTSGELGNGEVIQVETKCQVKKTKHREAKDDKEESLSPKEEVKKKIKWKKLISSALKSVCIDGLHHFYIPVLIYLNVRKIMHILIYTFRYNI